MLKLMIVDDEQIEREGLQAILLKGCPGVTIELAKNGAAAIELARTYRPDLVLMDIKMPGISGLEAAERIREEFPQVRFIMVTAYEMFEYARSAIKIGVEDYLLKPSRAGEIVETVTRAMNAIAAERSEWESKHTTEETLRTMMPVVEADVVTQLLFDHVHEVHLEDMVRMLGGESTREAFVMLLRMNMTPSTELFHRLLRERMREQGSGWVGALSGKHIPLIVFRETGKSYRAQASSMVQQLMALQQRAPGTLCFIGIGHAYGALEEIRLSYQEALIATADSGLPSKHRFYEDLPAIGELKEDYPNKQMEKQFIDHIRLGAWEDVQATVSDYIGRYEKNGFGLMLAGQRVLESLWVVYRVLSEMGIDTEKPYFSFQMQDYRELRAEAASGLDKLVRSAEQHRLRVEPDAVRQIKQYIAQHSAEDISLEAIAARVNLSPFYISKVFKEETGVNYIDYLTECRIERAKSLLTDQELSLKAITFEVGYNDPNYFSKVFKKLCGVSPSEYRKTLFNNRM